MGPRTPSDTVFPKSWPDVARAAVLHAVSLASTAMAVVRGRAMDSRRRQVWQHAAAEQLRNEITLLREELRLKDVRLETVLPPRRPRYRPIQRMAILELRAQRGWSLDETGQRFLVEPRTIAAWMKRLDERGERVLVQTPRPFGYWVAVVVDHFSRRAVGFAVYRRRPSPAEVTAFLGRAVQVAGAKPKYIVTDKGREFSCATFKRWCRRRRIRPRFGAVGEYGSIAIVERFIRSMKTECCRRIDIAMRLESLRKELSLYLGWFNHHRPHQGLAGRTPDEVYFHRRPANERPRYEPRARWSRRSPGASPAAKVKGQRGVRLHAKVSYLGGRQHLPIVALREAA